MKTLIAWVLVFCAGGAGAVDFSADQNAARALSTSMSSRASINQFISSNYGTIDTSHVHELSARGLSPEAHAASNTEKIASCRQAASRNYQGMSVQQKTECIAIITAAGNLLSPNPYLDRTNAKQQENQPHFNAMRQLSSQQAASATAPGGAAAYISPPVRAQSSCSETPSTLPAVRTTDRCHIEKPSFGMTCPVIVNISVSDGSVSTFEDAAACAIYDREPYYCEVGDTECVRTAVVEIGTDEAGNPITTVVCVEKRRGYSCFDINQPWDESGCESLFAKPYCTRGAFEPQKWIRGFPVWQDRLFQCVITPAVPGPPSEQCQTSFCIGDTCMDTTSRPSRDFVEMATGMEALREMGVYSSESVASCPEEISAFMQSCPTVAGHTYPGCDPEQMSALLSQYPQCYPSNITCPQHLRSFLQDCDDEEVGCDPSLKEQYLLQYPDCRLPGPPDVQPTNLRVFRGAAEKCTRPTGPGIGANCCKSSSGTPLKNNKSVLGSVAIHAAGSVVSSGVGYGVQAASNYMYDFMFNSNNRWMFEKAYSAWGSGAWDPAHTFNLSIGAFGFTASLGATTGAGFLVNASTSLFGAGSMITQGANMLGAGGNITLGTVGTGAGEVVFAFNPYMLAFSVATQVVIELYTCELDEKMLATKRGGNLCEKTGEYCSARIPLVRVCLQVTESWCCWNSRLAKTIGVEGGRQLGGGPRCEGFAPEEMARIDFSRMDLANFARDVMDSTVLPDGTYLSSTVAQGTNRGYEYSERSRNQEFESSVDHDPNLVNYVNGRVQTTMSR